jgi:kumamolisin
MATTDEFVAIPGSEHAQPPEAKLLGPADPDEVIQVTVMIRHKVMPDRKPLHELVAEIGASNPRTRKNLTHADFEQQYGAHQDDVSKVVKFAEANGLKVVETSLSKRSVRLSGTNKAFSAAFRVELNQYQLSDEIYRARSGPIYVPKDLGEIVVGVFGLENRAMFKPSAVVRAPRPAPGASPVALVAGDTPPFSPEQVAAFYNFPKNLDGTGQTIGIIELGGGYFSQDLQKFATHVPGRTDPSSSITIVHVDQAQNAPDPNGGERGLGEYSENLLDIEIIAAVAPKAKIVVYFAPNSGLLDAVAAAVDDSVNLPKVISISWGNPEDPANFQMLYDNMEQIFLKAASLNITICAASGDFGSTGGVYHPASSPNVLACGGTTLTSVVGGQVVEEDAWSRSGGGVSIVFPTPLFQATIGIQQATGKSGRGVPDVAGNADPASGYDIVSAAVDLEMSGGTSAVAPLWAALIARFNQDLASQSPGKSWGFITPLLYGFVAGGQTANGPFRDIVSGSNGGFSAGTGWDAVTGLGTPNGAALLELLQAAASADDDQ